ncbi:uncharacterized protein LOC115443248 [Manduca sexta]|uniref:uncharacterized protein LOC115443248 n=1 Tax=Manduca sexta TaxID=7130 RepID=UPI001181CC4E|nr:uncharacterized protein LOC115443248 [Manduca sexta]
MADEIEFALKQMKRGKASGEEGVSVKMLQTGRPSIYKLFAKVLCNRMFRLFEENQPVEQAGFRSGYSTTDLMHAVKQLIEKCREYHRPLFLAFVDYEKAFDSVEHWAIFNSLHRCGIDKQ